MRTHERHKLQIEYVERFSNIVYWPLKYSGYSRFSVVNTEIRKKTTGSIVTGVGVLILAIVALAYLFYELIVVVENMLKTEFTALLLISLAVYIYLVNVTFVNRNIGVNLIRRCIDIDVLLGVEETKFMRDRTQFAYLAMSVLVSFVQVIVVTLLYVSFKIPFFLHVIGSVYVFWAFFVLYDINFLLVLSAFVSMRIRYLNIAIMKRIDMRIDYIPNILFFDNIYWKTNYSYIQVKFEEAADTETYVKALKMIFALFHCIEKCYRLPLLLGVMSVTIGSLLSVQMFISYEAAGYGIVNKLMSLSWIVAIWSYFSAVSIHIDFFEKNIEQTKLICIYAQLTRANSDDILRMVKRILQPLEVRDTKASIFGLFYYDTNMMFRIAASTIVYITALLQISLTKLDESNNFNDANVTSTTNFI